VALILDDHRVNTLSVCRWHSGQWSRSPIWCERQQEASGRLHCIASIHKWCDFRRLQLNSEKTEVMWFGICKNLKSISDEDKQLNVAGAFIEPVDLVWDLGAYFDNQLNMQTHVSRITWDCFIALGALNPFDNNLDTLLLLVWFLRLSFPD
jgi:hypothetical protein